MAASATAAVRIDSKPAAHSERVFYLIAGFLVLATVATGFRQFYLHGRSDTGQPVTQQIAPFVILHGVAMSAWILLLIVQSTLIVVGNRRLHMKLGAAGGVLAILMSVTGIYVGIASVRIHYDQFRSQAGAGAAEQFLSIPLTAIVTFAVMAGLALKYRRRAEVHRPLMLLATLFVTAAATSRIHSLTNVLANATHNSMFFTNWFPVLALAGLLGLLKAAMTRSWDSYYAAGWAAIVLVAAVSVELSSTPAWQSIASMMLR